MSSQHVILSVLVQVLNHGSELPILDGIGELRMIGGIVMREKNRNPRVADF